MGVDISDRGAPLKLDHLSLVILSKTGCALSLPEGTEVPFRVVRKPSDTCGNAFPVDDARKSGIDRCLRDTFGQPDLTAMSFSPAG